MSTGSPLAGIDEIGRCEDEHLLRGYHLEISFIWAIAGRLGALRDPAEVHNKGETMSGTDDDCDIRDGEDVAAYVLGALDPADAEA